MTLELPAATPATAANPAPDPIARDIAWASPAVGLWVASRRGEHAGMVERSNGEYHARSARGRALGSFGDLDTARAVIAASVDDPAGAPGGNRTVRWAVELAAVATAVGVALFVVTR